MASANTPVTLASASMARIQEEEARSVWREGGLSFGFEIRVQGPGVEGCLGTLLTPARSRERGKVGMGSGRRIED